MKVVQAILSWVGAATVGGLIVGVFGGAVGPSGEFIQAKQFVLLDGNGKRCGQFGIQGNGPELAIMDPQGRRRIVFRVSPEGIPRFEMFGPKEHSEFSVNVADDDSVGFVELKNQKSSIQMMASQDGALVRLRNKDGKETIVTPEIKGP